MAVRPAWHSENIIPLPKLVEFSLSYPLSGIFFGVQAALCAHYQMGSKWNFSPFKSDFTIDQVHCGWNVGLLFPFPQQLLVWMAVRGQNCPLLMYFYTRTDTGWSCWNFALLGPQRFKLSHAWIFWLLATCSKEEALWCFFSPGKMGTSLEHWAWRPIIIQAIYSKKLITKYHYFIVKLLKSISGV